MPRSLTRFAATATVGLVGLIWLLSYTLEPRRTAYSCRTFWSCVGVGSRHTYQYPLPDASPSTETETQLRDGTLRHLRSAQDASPATLVLVLLKDAGSWSSDFRSARRTAYDFMDILISTRLNLSAVSLAVMTASAEEYEAVKVASARLPLARTTIYYRKSEDDGFAYHDRHKPQVQLARRSALAILRNYLMLRALQDEKHLVWLDADVVAISDNIIPTMISSSDNSEDAGIITALCHQNQMANYDKNAWKVGDSRQLLGPIADVDRDSAVTDLVATRIMIPELINGTDDSALVPLDSVGGTILYIRAELVRQGVRFPHFNVVGTTWTQAGWIGVETEGICYVAKGLKGGGCYVMGGKHHVRHTDWG